MTLESPGRDDISIELDTPEKVEASKSKTFVLKEGSDYRIKVVFKVQHEIVTGLKYIQVVKRMGVKGFFFPSFFLSFSFFSFFLIENIIPFSKCPNYSFI